MKSLVEFQKLLIDNGVQLKKDAKGYNYKYITLDELLFKINPYLIKAGLSITSFTQAGVLETIVTEVGTKEFISTSIDLNLFMEDDLSKIKMSKMQYYGSLITYARRYNILNLLNLVADNDDDCAVTSDTASDTAKKENKTQSPLSELYSLFKDSKSKDFTAWAGVKYDELKNNTAKSQEILSAKKSNAPATQQTITEVFSNDGDLPF